MMEAAAPPAAGDSRWLFWTQTCRLLAGLPIDPDLTDRLTAHEQRLWSALRWIAGSGPRPEPAAVEALFGPQACSPAPTELAWSQSLRAAADSLRMAEAALAHGDWAEARRRFQRCVEQAEAQSRRLDPERRVRRAGALEATLLPAALSPAADQGAPLIRTTTADLATRVFAWLSERSTRGTPGGPPPLLVAPVALTTAEAGALDARLLDLGDAVTARERWAYRRGRAADVRLERQRFWAELGRQVDAVREDDAATDARLLELRGQLDSHARAFESTLAGAIRDKLDVCAAVGQRIERLRVAVAGIEALASQERSVPHLDIHHRTLAKDATTLAALQESLAGAQHAVAALVRSDLERSVWPELTASLARAEAGATRVQALLDMATPDSQAGLGPDTGRRVERALDEARRALLAELTRVDRAAHRRAAHELALVREAATFGTAEALLAAARQNGEPSGRVAALEAFEQFVATPRLGPAGGAAWLRLVELREPGGAVAAAQHFLEHYPEHPGTARARFNLGIQLARLGQPRRVVEALTHFRRAHPSHPRVPEAALHQAMAHVALGEVEAAGALLEPVSHQPDPLGLAAAHRLAWCRLTGGEPAGAAEAFAAVLNHPAGGDSTLVADAHRNLGRALAEAGSASAAASFLATHRPADARSWQGAVVAYEERARHAESLALVDEASQRFAHTPDLPTFQDDALRIYDALGQAPEAAQVALEAAAHTGPASAWFGEFGSERWAARADSLQLAGSATLLAAARQASSQKEADHLLDLATHGYTQYLELFPKSESAAEAALALAECQLALARPAVAVSTYEHALALAAADPALERQALRGAVVAWGAVRAGRDTTGVSAELVAIDRYLEVTPPDRVSVLRRRGQILLQAERFGEAAESFGVAVAMAPAGALRQTLRRSLADAELRGGRPGAAVLHYQALLREDNLDPELAAETARLLPAARFQAAASLAETTPLEAARAYEAVAGEHPEFTEADLALLRAADAYERAGRPQSQERVLERLVTEHAGKPNHAPALLRLAESAAKGNRPAVEAARLLEFSEVATAPLERDGALLAAVDAAGKARRPDLVSKAAALYLEGRALGDPVAAGVALAEARAWRHTDRRRAGARLDILCDDPAVDAATRGEAAFERALWASPSYRAIRLNAPVVEAIATKQDALAPIAADLGSAVAVALPPIAARAEALLGDCMADFALALRESEVPVDLLGDDLLTYSTAVAAEAERFAERAERGWGKALNQARALNIEAPWVNATRTQLFARYDQRYAELPASHLAGPTFGDFDLASATWAD